MEVASSKLIKHNWGLKQVRFWQSDSPGFPWIWAWKKLIEVLPYENQKSLARSNHVGVNDKMFIFHLEINLYISIYIEYIYIFPIEYQYLDMFSLNFLVPHKRADWNPGLVAPNFVGPNHVWLSWKSKVCPPPKKKYAPLLKDFQPPSSSDIPSGKLT